MTRRVDLGRDSVIGRARLPVPAWVFPVGEHEARPQPDREHLRAEWVSILLLEPLRKQCSHPALARTFMLANVQASVIMSVPCWIPSARSLLAISPRCSAPACPPPTCVSICCALPRLFSPLPSPPLCSPPPSSAGASIGQQRARRRSVSALASKAACATSASEPAAAAALAPGPPTLCSLDTSAWCDEKLLSVCDGIPLTVCCTALKGQGKAVEGQGKIKER